MTRQSHILLDANNQQLHTQSWLTEGAPQAHLLIIHGLAEHSGRYDRFARALNAHSYHVWALDLQGHGQSDGRPGFVDNFEDYLDAVTRLRDEIDRDNPHIPVFLLGHSMGGLLATRLLLQSQQRFQGCILSGAALQTVQQFPSLQQTLLRLLSKIAPRLGVLQLDADGVSRDPDVVADYRSDPLNYTGKISARSVNELLESMAFVRERAQQITLPLLIMHGLEDSMAAAEGSQWLYDHCGSTDKTLELLPGLYHEILNEPERDQITATITNWMDTHQS